MTASDVNIAINLGWGHHQPITLRSGGHSTAGYSASSGTLIDVSNLNDVTVDLVQSLLSVGPGTNFGKLNAILAADNVHIPAGECDDVCVGGFMRGGGYGFTSRTFGIFTATMSSACRSCWPTAAP